MKQVINNFVRLRTKSRKARIVHPNGTTAMEGLRVSRQAVSTGATIALTPYSKTMFEVLDKGQRLLVGDPTTKMEEHIEKETMLLLNKYCGKEQLSYDVTKPADSAEHYSVDCWRNFKRGSDLRHASKKSYVEERVKQIRKFEKPTKDVNMVWLLKNDHEVQAAVALLKENIPEVTSSNKWLEVNSPFMNKKTNVGYPYFKRDDKIDPVSGKTYARLTSDQARKMSPEQVVGLPFVEFARLLRGKPRVIMGSSRLQSLVFNQLEAVEIDSCKTLSPFFIGYNAPDVQKERMIKIAKWLDAHTDYTCKNRDYISYDATVPFDLRLLVGAVNETRIKDSRGKRINDARVMSQNKADLISGSLNKVAPIHGRIFSGELDTNLGGGKAQIIPDVDAILKQDSQWVQECFEPLKTVGTSAVWVMGDDNLIVHKRSLVDDMYNKHIKDRYNLEVSHDKGEFGLFFGQRRLIKVNNNYLFLTPFTRIIRQLAMKEASKGLGPAGWTVASWMTLVPLLDWPELLIDVVNIFMPYDKMRFGKGISLTQIKNMLKAEDLEARRKLKNKGQGYKTTAEKLFDGDPLKVNYYSNHNKNLRLQLDDESVLEKVHRLIQSSGKR